MFQSLLYYENWNIPIEKRSRRKYSFAGVEEEKDKEH
jgi:hypothetical protein